MDKFEFGGRAWMAALRELLVAYTQGAGTNFEVSLCEVFTNVPKHLDPSGDGTLAWHGVVKNGVVHFDESELADADIHSTVDYDFALPLARLVLSPETAGQLQAAAARGIAEGKLKLAGRDRSKMPAAFQGLHNDMAVRTL
ncbi:MAG: hypothetical protein WDN01_01700 [Rhizomicrobium sp.]